MKDLLFTIAFLAVLIGGLFSNLMWFWFIPVLLALFVVTMVD